MTNKSIRNLTWYRWIGEDVAKSLCMCCEKEPIKMFNFECGHVIAKANGGQMDIENLRPICGICNKSMKTEHMAIFKKKNNYGSINKLYTNAEGIQEAIPEDIEKLIKEMDELRESKIDFKPKIEEIVQDNYFSSGIENRRLRLDFYSGLKKNCYIAKNSALYDMIFMLDRDYYSNEMQITRVLGKIPNLKDVKLNKDYEKDIQELTIEEQELIKIYNVVYSYINLQPNKSDEILAWRSGLLKWKLPKYIEVSESYNKENVENEIKDLYQLFKDNVYKRID